jgi:hypothetical protein
MELISCGTEVKTKIGNLKCLISEIYINYDNVKYKLTYLHNGKFETVTMSFDEFEIISETKKTIVGFN